MPAEAPTSLLLTSFGPFPGVPLNPTRALARRASQQLRVAHPGHTIDTLELPTEFDTAWARLAERLEQGEAPRAIIALGVAASSTQTRLECLAVNHRCTDKPDAAGVCASSSVLVEGAPDHLPTTLPVGAIHASLRARGLPARTSASAGDYICNALFFRLMWWGASQPAPVRAGFVHVPDPADRAAADLLVEVVGCVGEVVLRYPGPRA